MTRSASFSEHIESGAVSFICHATAVREAAAIDYLSVLGRSEIPVQIHEGSLDWAEIAAHDDDTVVPLFFIAATDSDVREQFFGRLPLRFFVDHFYRPEPGYVSNRLFVVGTTDAAWQRLGSPSALASPESVGRRLEKLKSRFGSDYFHPVEMEQALQSKSLRTVRLHALGSAGTNIARASYRFVKAQRIRARTEIVVHPDKVEPMEYAQIAAEEQRDGVLSLHTECAVYYELDRLFETRSTELVFASHYYMPLDGMRLATRSDSPVVTRRIASHPSPQGLVEPWVRDGAELVHASSNSHAAAMVLSGEADMCVTTASAAHSMDLKTVEDFGSPTMLFTLGTPLDAEQMRQLF